MAEVTNEEVKNEYEVKPETNSTIELVRNPYIAFYLYDKQISNFSNPDDFKLIINPNDIIPVNQDVLYNDKVSAANNQYKYTNRIKEVTNIRYVKSTSDAISEDYKHKLEARGTDETVYLVPLDYILVTRNNGSQFMIAEDFTNTSIPRGMHRYSIIRFENDKNPYKLDSIYSDGIDLSRVLANDAAYIDVFANSFLDNQRLENSLVSTFKEIESEDSQYGGGYVGYIDANTLSIDSSMEKSELVAFEKELKMGGLDDEWS